MIHQDYTHIIYISHFVRLKIAHWHESKCKAMILFILHKTAYFIPQAAFFELLGWHLDHVVCSEY